MIIYPAIDILGGKAVRLVQGDFATAKSYSDDPADVARRFERDGARHLHIVDLDGAKSGHPVNVPIIKAVRSVTTMHLQVGGGMRDHEGIKAMLDSGVDQVVLGSVAIRDCNLTVQLLKTFGSDKLTIAVDCVLRDGIPLVAINGWQTTTRVSVLDLIDHYVQFGLQRVICTDVERDGMQQGANSDLYLLLRRHYPELKVQASGGVSRLEELANFASQGIESCVVGKAIYEGTFTVQEALAVEGVRC